MIDRNQPWVGRRRRSLGHRIALSLLLLLIAKLAAPRAALAHAFDPALLDLREERAGEFGVVWKVPGTGRAADLTPRFPTECNRLDAHGADGDGPQHWRVNCGSSGLRGARLAVSGLDRNRIEAIVRITWLDGTVIAGVLHGDNDEFAVPRAPWSGAALSGAPARGVLWSYLRLGIDHILFGFDHLLFVLGLLLLVERTGLLIKTITAFTVAHSLALALAVMGVVKVPAAPVEALIALSIVLVAYELTRANGPASLVRQYPWAVAFAFGLLHGLGFAGALAEIGLPAGQIPLALLAFNLGVEIGQLAFVLVMLFPLKVFARLAATRPWLRWLPAYAIGALAMAWVFERIERFWVPFS